MSEIVEKKYLDVSDDGPLPVDQAEPLVHVVDPRCEGDEVLEDASPVCQAQGQVVGRQVDRLAGVASVERLKGP